jgi:hypothetical protein
MIGGGWRDDRWNNDYETLATMALSRKGRGESRGVPNPFPSQRPRIYSRHPIQARKVTAMLISNSRVQPHRPILESNSNSAHFYGTKQALIVIDL